MADTAPDGESALRREFLSQTARIRWRELQTHFARGCVIAVAPALDLVEVAVQLARDNSDRFREWIDAGDIAPVSDAQAARWLASECELWAVVAAPWVLVQARD